MENLIVAVLVRQFSSPALHNYLHESPPVGSVLSELNAFHTFTPCCIKRNFNIIPSMPGFPKWPFPVSFSEQILLWISYVVRVSYMPFASPHAWSFWYLWSLCLLQNVQTGSGTHSASCSVGTVGRYRERKAAWLYRSPVILHLVPRFGMRGERNPALLYAFVACTWTTFPLGFIIFAVFGMLFQLRRLHCFEFWWHQMMMMDLKDLESPLFESTIEWTCKTQFKLIQIPNEFRIVCFQNTSQITTGVLI